MTVDRTHAGPLPLDNKSAYGNPVVIIQAGHHYVKWQPKNSRSHSHMPIAIRQQDSTRTADRTYTDPRHQVPSQSKDSRPHVCSHIAIRQHVCRRKYDLGEWEQERNDPGAKLPGFFHHSKRCQPMNSRSHSYRPITNRQQDSKRTADPTYTGPRHQATSQSNDSRPQACRPIAIRQVSLRKFGRNHTGRSA